MTEANQTAERHLYDVMNIFTIRYEDGSRLPATAQEIDEARELLKKAREAGPDDPDIVKWLQETEKMIDEAPKRKWRGSFFIIFVALFFIYFAFNSQSRNIVRNMFEWPETSTIRFNIKRDITGMARTFAEIQGLPDNNPRKARRLEAANERLEHLRNLDPVEERERIKSEKLNKGLWRLFGMIYFPAMLILYIYSTRAPQYLIWRRQRSFELMKKSGNILVKSVWWISRSFFFMGKLSYKIFNFSSSFRTPGYHPRASVMSHGDSGFFTGIFAAIMFFIFGLFFIVFVFVKFANLIASFLWLIVLVYYMRNYQHDRLELWKRKLKDKYTQWRDTRARERADENLSLEDGPMEEP